MTNPPADAVPEVVRIESGFMGPMPWLSQRSSLVSLRDNTVLKWEDDYLELYELLVAAAEEFREVKQRNDLVLDL